MRLINVNTFRLEDFIEAEVPAYAILSHTWEDEEVSYADMINAISLEALSEPKYDKIRGCTNLAKDHKLDYIWVDTCCIDKSSSAELQEAINSMFRWYKRAQVCFVYLSDYQWVLDEPSFPDLQKSRWITRGWTLQELIAPSNLKFYDSSWTYLGIKKNNLRSIEKATGISYAVLDRGDLSTASVAQRMSWASRRNCTRVEDVAYSLMGIFNINMPMLYGEGENAFLRLQEEIIRTTFDQSIFAWTDQDPDKTGHAVYRGLLARSPTEFASCASMYSQPTIHYSVPYSVTNLGVLLETTLEVVQSSSEEIYVAPLKDIFNDFKPVKRARRPGETITKSPVGILLKRLTPGSNQFARVCPHLVVNQDTRGRLELEITSEKIYVKQNQAIPESYFTSSIYGFRITSARSFGANGLLLIPADLEVRRLWPASQWSQDQRLLRAETGMQKTLAAVWFEKFNEFDDVVLLLSYEPATLEKRFHFVRSLPVGTEEKELQGAVENALVGVQEIKSIQGVYDYESFKANVLVVATLWGDRVVLDLSMNIH